MIFIFETPDLWPAIPLENGGFVTFVGPESPRRVKYSKTSPDKDVTITISRELAVNIILGLEPIPIVEESDGA